MTLGYLWGEVVQLEGKAQGDVNSFLQYLKPQQEPFMSARTAA